MSKPLFNVGPVGGFPKPLTAPVKRRFKARFPKISVAAFETEASNYIMWRDSPKPQQKPSDMRAELLDLAKQMKALQSAIEAMESKYQNVIREAASEIGERLKTFTEITGIERDTTTEGNFMTNVANICNVGDAVMKKAAAKIPLGYWIKPREQLILNLCKLLSDAGYQVDKTPTGNVTWAVELILKDAGDEDIKDVRKIVARTLKDLDNSPQN